MWTSEASRGQGKGGSEEGSETASSSARGDGGSGEEAEAAEAAEAEGGWSAAPSMSIVCTVQLMNAAAWPSREFLAVY